MRILSAVSPGCSSADSQNNGWHNPPQTFSRDFENRFGFKASLKICMYAMAFNCIWMQFFNIHAPRFRAPFSCSTENNRATRNHYFASFDNLHASRVGIPLDFQAVRSFNIVIVGYPVAFCGRWATGSIRSVRKSNMDPNCVIPIKSSKVTTRGSARFLAEGQKGPPILLHRALSRIY